ncbi:MAG: dTDP-4-amino-4,6-dideoxygalactose transaminase [Brevinema sp.]
MILFTDSRNLLKKYSFHIEESLNNGFLYGDGKYTHAVQDMLQISNKVLMTTSCTDALELSALLLNIQAGDEIIAPSFTFVSTVNAFILYGAKVKFVDIDPKTLNMDVSLVEQAITPQTKAIIPVHYGGVSVDMDPLLAIAKKYNVAIVEDAAQGVNAFYKGKALGYIGDFGVFSFHDTKNYTMGEGGALLLNDPQYIDRAEILREKGTNRTQHINGQIDKYTWVDKGSSFLAADLNCALLLGQLENIKEINQNRSDTWNFYHDNLQDLADSQKIEIPFIPDYAQHNAHMYYIKCSNVEERTAFIKYMKEQNIHCHFHYIPLHSSPAGLKYGEFIGEDKYTTKESERLVRLPLWYGMSQEQLETVILHIRKFFSA